MGHEEVYAMCYIIPYQNCFSQFSFPYYLRHLPLQQTAKTVSSSVCCESFMIFGKRLCQQEGLSLLFYD